MPRYIYQCNECDKTNYVFHRISESHSTCLYCNCIDCLEKMLTKPTIKKEAATTGEEKIGELTNKYIEDNRKILDDMKKECKEETHEPS